MEIRNVGSSGLRVSAVGLGCNNFGGSRCDYEQSRQIVFKALDLGITMLDSADTYGNRGECETILGKCLGVRRNDIVLATKGGLPMDDARLLKGASRRYIMSALEASLSRLKTDWVDIYYIHRPDPLTPIEETLRALDDMVKAGKIRYIGCSGYAAWQLVEALLTSRYEGLNRFIVCQDEYNLLSRGVEGERATVMRSYGLGLIPYSPLAAGMLTGKYLRHEPMPAGARMTLEKHQAERWINDTNWDKVERLNKLCAANGRSLLELAMSWLIARPLLCSVIAGATSPEQLEANVRATGWRLSSDELAAIDRATSPTK